MTLQQLRYLTTIIRCGSITEAARQLYVSQPSLSSSIKDLEQEFGIEILNRSAKGISLTPDGVDFLSYARQILEQTELLEQRYIDRKPSKQLCSISTQHYAFAVNAFVNLLASLDAEEYVFTLRETRTFEIIEDVSELRSEIGILYLSDFNRKVIERMLSEQHLLFHPLFEAEPHVFLSRSHPLAERERVTLADLDDYPFLAFEQGTFNSFYFSEEVLSTAEHRKTIRVSDRATLFNLLLGLNAYTICSGVLNSDLNGDNIVSVRLDADELMCVGWIVHEKAQLSAIAARYIAELKRLIAENGFTVLS